MDLDRASRGLRAWLSVAVGVVVLALAAGLGLLLGGPGGLPGLPRTGGAAPTGDAGVAAPEFELPAFGAQGTIASENFKGTPLVLNFWASWCPFCVEEMPDFEKVHQQFAGRVAFLGVALQDDPRLAADLLRRTGVTYPIAEDPSGSLFVAARGLGMPTTLLITADWRVATRVTGPLDADGLEELVRRHLLAPEA